MQLSTPPFVLSHAGAAVITGITKVHIPPTDTPDSLENGTIIPDLRRTDIQSFCPDSRVVTVHG